MTDNETYGASGTGGGQRQQETPLPDMADDTVRTAAPGADWTFLPQSLQGAAGRYENPEAFWAEVAAGLNPPQNPADYVWPETWRVDGASGDVAGRVNALLTESGEEMRALACAAGLSQKQAEALYSAFTPMLARAVEAQTAPPDPAETARLLAELWPEDTAGNMDIARRGARSLGLADALDQAGLSLNPLVLRLAHAVGGRTVEDALFSGGGAGLPAGQAAYEEMLRIAGSEGYRNREPAIVRMFEALSKRV